MIVITLLILCLVLIVLLTISVRYNLKTGELILNIEEEIESSLEILDNSYFKISKILEMPIGCDDPWVISVVEEIKRSHDSILLIANKLTSDWKNNGNNDA